MEKSDSEKITAGDPAAQNTVESGNRIGSDVVASGNEIVPEISADQAAAKKEEQKEKAAQKKSTILGSDKKEYGSRISASSYRQIEVGDTARVELGISHNGSTIDDSKDAYLFRAGESEFYCGDTPEEARQKLPENRLTSGLKFGNQDEAYLGKVVSSRPESKKKKNKAGGGFLNMFKI